MTSRFRGTDTALEALEDLLHCCPLVPAAEPPDLQADASFRQLQTELADTETRLAFARDFANHRVATYHELLETFPSVLVAGPFGFERRQLFRVDATEARRVPSADLSPGAGS